MKKRYILIIVSTFIIITAVFTISMLFTVLPSDPLVGSEQLVLVLSRTQNARKAVLQTFNREGDSWRFYFSFPVVIGKNGMAWGRGLHKDSDCTDGEPVKFEGDGTTPQGGFELLHAYGYSPPSAVRIRFPYTLSTPDMICIDDPGSKYYNKIVNINQKGLNRENLPSHETLVRDDDLYKYTILVGHNTWRPEKGAGSCIFLHVWEGPNSYTSGCTAMAEENILRLLAWLNAEKTPVLIQLTRKNYYRLREGWGLPDVTI